MASAASALRKKRERRKSLQSQGGDGGEGYSLFFECTNRQGFPFFLFSFRFSQFRSRWEERERGKENFGAPTDGDGRRKRGGGEGEKIGRFCNFSKKNGSRGRKRRKQEKMGEEEEKFLISAPLGKKRGALFLCRSSWRGFFAELSPPFYLQCTVGPNPNQPRKATV